MQFLFHEHVRKSPGLKFLFLMWFVKKQQNLPVLSFLVCTVGLGDGACVVWDSGACGVALAVFFGPLLSFMCLLCTSLAPVSQQLHRVLSACIVY